ncbi:MAG: ribose 5-phosphate isomerase A, partial [Burkholderiaceae bacterium]|nr:ribose 5-phosphate isomerase A [Burkholderiaceae bacterium]
MLTQNELKQQAADAALELVETVLGSDVVFGVGTGSTADLFIDGLAR